MVTEYHTFLSSDADGLTMNRTANVEILLIAGGGGGGAGHYGGGGGAGGLINTTVTLPAGNYPVQIGAYGAGSVNTGTDASAGKGGDSTFHTQLLLVVGAVVPERQMTKERW